MNRRDLIAAIAEDTELSKVEVTKVLDSFQATVTKTIGAGDPVMLSGFCKFNAQQKPARKGRNPQTGATIQIPARRAVRVTPLKAFKDAVLAIKPTKAAAAKKR